MRRQGASSSASRAAPSLAKVSLAGLRLLQLVRCDHALLDDSASRMRPYAKVVLYKSQTQSVRSMDDQHSREDFQPSCWA